MAAQVPQGGLGHILTVAVGGSGSRDEASAPAGPDVTVRSFATGHQVPDQHAGLFLEGEQVSGWESGVGPTLTLGIHHNTTGPLATCSRCLRSTGSSSEARLQFSLFGTLAG